MANKGLPFAMALLDLANEAGKQQAWQDQLIEIGQILKNEPEYLQALESPAISREVKIKWLSELFENQIDPTLQDMLQVAVAHDAAGQLPEIAACYKDLYEKEQGIVVVNVTSAIVLDEGRLEKLKNRLEKELGAKVRIELAVDPSLLGGLVIKTPDKMMDTSVKGRLETLKERLRQE